jgi:hypothetical protein
MENLEILWLDDQRDPIKYFKKKPDEKNATVTRNFAYYKNLFSKYNVSFVWVKSYDAFVDHITNNGVPKFISFDYNLKKGTPTGIDCVNWLLNYCKENGVSMPKSYVHSANPRFGPEMNRMLGLSENKKRTIRLTESKLKNIITECVRETLKENQEYLPWYIDDVQNNLIEIKRIVSYLVNDYLDNISQEQLDKLGDITEKYRQFLSSFMKQIDSKRW